MMRGPHRSQSLLLAAAVAAAPCCTAPRYATVGGSSGGAVVGGGGTAARGLIEVRGFALTPSDRVPAGAIGYAVPIFTDRTQASRFCPLFRSRLSFAGALHAETPLKVQSYGRIVQIAPFVWPVTTWRAGDRPDCTLLVERYDVSGARSFLTLAQQAIRDLGGGPADSLEGGPFIVTARRVSGAVMVYDLSRAPDNDYGKWLSRAVTDLSDPFLTEAVVVKPTRRDQVRAFVFGTIPSWRGILGLLVPGFKDEQDRG